MSRFGIGNEYRKGEVENAHAILGCGLRGRGCDEGKEVKYAIFCFWRVDRP